MSREYKLMFDPTPAGWAYGFPREIPESAVLGKGTDLFISNDFNLTEWVTSFGYPEESFQYYKTWPEKIEYYTPGSDPQV